ncbi:hypothetical protein ABMA28_013712 [Loxostege sticticalis]|uniref:Integrase catalytic domain-containing protein n=1 Tax=Loxostege sticticalis TaxID=481309 RepID=A0ABD0TJA0_LOXSC
MEKFSTKISIGNLEGKANWTTWKYKISIMLRGTTDAMEIVEGRLKRPVAPQDGAGDAAVATYDRDLARYKQADCSALLILTTNMTEETLEKVMRFESAYEVWRELHQLFDGQSEDGAYTACMDFFSFKRNMADDVSTHLSKLKNIWSKLNIEIKKSDASSQLPDLFLICKILESLDDRFFAFKSSWLLLNKTERTIDNLTTQLCSYERALENKEGISSQETLLIKEVQKSKKKDKFKVKNCKKWIKDGRPPKPSSSAQTNSSKQVQSITLMAVNAYSKAADQDRDNWFVDNGATTHIATRRDMFQKFEPFDNDQSVKTADGTMIPALGKGIVCVESNVGNKKETIQLKDVWLVPTLTKNLFSTLAAQDNMRNSLFTSTAESCQLDIDGVTRIVGKRELRGGLYKLQFKTIAPSKESNTIEVNAITGTNMLQVYHERFAHQDKRHVKALVKREFGIDLPEDSAKCEACIFGKAHRTPFGRRERAAIPGELIHTDVCGPFEHPSEMKYRYFVLFKDDYSSYRLVYFMRQKSEVKDKLKLMLNEIKTVGHTVKCLLSDNGGGFDNEEQNGCSERENRTLVEAARTMLHARGELPQKLWAELINTAAYVLNRTGPTRVMGKVPYELWFNKKPRLTHLRVIGSECNAHIPKQCRKKLCKKAMKGVLIGYENDDGYRIWNGAKTIRSRDITFRSEVEFKIGISDQIQTPTETEGDSTINSDAEIDTRLEQQRTQPQSDRDLEGELVEDHDQGQQLEGDHDQGEPLVGDHDQSESLVDDQGDFYDAEGEPVVIEEPRYNLRDRSSLHRPQRYDDFICSVSADEFPNSYREAMEREDCEEWLKAMKNEIESLKENNVWTLCDLPPQRKALPYKWIFRIKRNPDGSIEKYKARLVVKGFRQKKGIDYDQTFSPVARMASVRALLSVCAKENMHLIQFDVVTAFLNGSLKEEIFMQQPEGLNDGTARVWKLNRSLYGLKQAPRCWNTCFEQILLDLKFKQCEADCCLFAKHIGQEKILIALYVDDGLVAASSEKLALRFLDELGSKLKITVKPANFYLGLEIKQEKNSIFISQAAYLKRILERFNMLECNPVSTPIEKSVSVEDSDSGKVGSFPYREAVGALMYLMTGTRPDIAYAVGVVSRKLANPSKEDWLKVKRIFRYLKGTMKLGIKYQSGKEGFIEGYSDADHAGDSSTGRSTSGVACLYAGGIVSWLSQRQPSVAISTTEAEIVAASEAAKELIWLQTIFGFLTKLDGIPTLHVDNEAAIRLAHNPEFHKRTKHIRVRHFFVREMVSEGNLHVLKISSANQLADIMTKAVPKPRLLQMCAKLGLKHYVLNEGKSDFGALNVLVSTNYLHAFQTDNFTNSYITGAPI